MTDATLQSAPILLIGTDHEWSARALDAALGPRGYTIVRSILGQDTIDLARRMRPDAIMLDCSARAEPVLETCRRLRGESAIGEATPILLTAPGGMPRTSYLSALQSGAWDVLFEPLDAEIIHSKLRSLVTAKRALDRCRAVQLLDPATGLYTAQGLARRVREIAADSARRCGALTCMAFSADVDGTGATADIADHVALHTGQLCLGCGRASDIFGRFGEGEYAVVAPATGREGAELLAARLRERFTTEPLVIGGQRRTLTLTIGLSCSPDYSRVGVDGMDFMLRATRALRYARSSGASGGLAAFDELPVTWLQ